MQIIYFALFAALLASAFSPPAHAQAQIAIPGVGQLTVPGPGQAPPPPGYGQAPPPGYGQAPPSGYGQAPPSGYGQGDRNDHERREHCERLRDREHEIRQRLEHTAYGEDRERMEYRLREIHEQREQCWHH